MTRARDAPSRWCERSPQIRGAATASRAGLLGRGGRQAVVVATQGLKPGVSRAQRTAQAVLFHGGAGGFVTNARSLEALGSGAAHTTSIRAARVERWGTAHKRVLLVWAFIPYGQRTTDQDVARRDLKRELQIQPETLPTQPKAGCVGHPKAFLGWKEDHPRATGLSRVPGMVFAWAIRANRVPC
jgi:hypothetical protein